MSLTYQRKLQIFSSILAAALLAACGAQGNPGAPPVLNLAQPLTSSRTFHFTHAAQKFKVPQGVTQLTITAFGAQGGGLTGSKYVPPGALGAKISATFSVNGGALLVVYVGGKGIKGGAHGNSGGFNGGGGSYTGAYGGGGSSDVRTAGDKLTDRIIVAAGGGGSGASGEGGQNHGTSYGSYYSLYGGPGGVGGRWNGASGGSGDSGGEGGGGGYQTFGGAGGAGRSGSSQSFSYYYSCNAVYGSQGKPHSGGEGADGSCGPPGGGGGGGYYGAGGGGGGGYQGYTATGTISYYSGGGGGGGGGSSFVEKSATHRKTGQGRSADGLVIIEW